MKKYLILFCALIILSCSVKKTIVGTGLYNVLTEQKDGGASIQFYEIISEAKEIKMLLNDENLKNKIQEKDIQTSNFVILNAGKKTIGNNKIEIENVEETPNRIVITIKDNSKVNLQTQNQETVNPYLILKINSKKEIEFK
ncbi:MAG: hypothetical protein H7174_02840 [Flavobacterium sp.]|nr:hypothetical protein [Flavobacterium sp.]